MTASPTSAPDPVAIVEAFIQAQADSRAVARETVADLLDADVRVYTSGANAWAGAARGRDRVASRQERSLSTMPKGGRIELVGLSPVGADLVVAHCKRVVDDVSGPDLDFIWAFRVDAGRIVDSVHVLSGRLDDWWLSIESPD